jgi:GNAT superfamily N-acetyltransferase
VAIRVLARNEIDLIWTIDRSEVHHHIYRNVDDRLTLVPAYFDIPGWHPKMIETDRIKLLDCFDRGGIFLGDFQADRLAGVSVVDTKPIKTAPDHLQLLYLYVSRHARRQGVGGRLLEVAAAEARALGAKALYISATPTENTVNFYMRRGSSLIADPDPDLFTAEPEDIHLVYPL